MQRDVYSGSNIDMRGMSETRSMPRSKYGVNGLSWMNCTLNHKKGSPIIKENLLLLLPIVNDIVYKYMVNHTIQECTY